MELTLDIGYHNHLLYKNASISIPDNGIVSFIGDNGSGKSTIYKTLLGIINPLNGTVPKSVQTNIGVVSDYVHLPDEVKIKNIIDLLGEKRASFAQSHYPDLHDYVKNFNDNKIGKLSSGQRRIIEIYVVLAAGKRIIILDEASNSLDYKNKKLFLTQVKKLSSQIVFLHTSHDLEDIVLLQGKVYGLFKSEKSIREYNGAFEISSIRKFLDYEVDDVKINKV